MSRIIKSDSPAKGLAQDMVFSDLAADQTAPTRKPRRFKPADFVSVTARPERVFSPRYEGPDAGREGAPKGGGAAEPAPPKPEEILARAEEEAGEIRDRAREEGRQAGLEEGRLAGREEIGQAAERLLALVQDLDRLRAETLAEAEEEIIGLVVLAASKIAAREIRTDPRLVVNLIKEAVERLSRPVRLKIRVNPQDLELVEDYKARVKDERPELQRIELAADPEVPSGGCLVESERETIESTLESRLASLSQIMEQALKGGPNAA